MVRFSIPVMQQPRQSTFAQIEAALAEVGATLTHVVRTRIFVRHIDDWEAVARAHGHVFGTIRPACTLVRAEPIQQDMLVEIEADALL